MHTRAHMCTISTVSPAYQDPVHLHVIYHNINAHMYDAAHHRCTRVKQGNTHVYQTHNTRDTCLLFRIPSFSSYHVRVAMFLHITHAKPFTLSHLCERKTTFFHTGLPNDGMCTQMHMGSRIDTQPYTWTRTHKYAHKMMPPVPCMEITHAILVHCHVHTHTHAHTYNVHV